MTSPILSPRIGVLFLWATISGVFGQAVTSTPINPQSLSTPVTQQNLQDQATINSYQQAQQTLIQEKQALIAQGATDEQLAAWQQQNATQIAAMQQQAEAMAKATALQIWPTNVQPNIPANASQALKDFLTTQATLANAKAQIHNQVVQTIPSTATSDQVGQALQQGQQLFQQQNAGLLQVQVQQAQALANETAAVPRPLPGPTQIPANATPQMAAYLTLRDQLMTDQITVWNQYVGAAPSVRDAAMLQWRQQNAARFQQFQQLAQNIAQTSPTTPN